MKRKIRNDDDDDARLTTQGAWQSEEGAEREHTKNAAPETHPPLCIGMGDMAWRYFGFLMLFI